jgi:hypothetical protein
MLLMTYFSLHLLIWTNFFTDQILPLHFAWEHIVWKRCKYTNKRLFCFLQPPTERATQKLWAETLCGIAWMVIASAERYLLRFLCKRNIWLDFVECLKSYSRHSVRKGESKNEESLCKLIITILVLYIPLTMFYIFLFFYHCRATVVHNSW